MEHNGHKTEDPSIKAQRRAKLLGLLDGLGEDAEMEIVRILDELSRALIKYPEWPTDPLHALAVLGEEFGELTQALLQMTYEPHKTSKEHIQVEATQTAAMSLRLAFSLNRYQYKECPQHKL